MEVPTYLWVSLIYTYIHFYKFMSTIGRLWYGVDVLNSHIHKFSKAIVYRIRWVNTIELQGKPPQRKPISLCYVYCDVLTLTSLFLFYSYSQNWVLFRATRYSKIFNVKTNRTNSMTESLRPIRCVKVVLKLYIKKKFSWAKEAYPITYFDFDFTD